MTVHDVTLQKAGSQDGFSIEWIDHDHNPVLELFRSDKDGVRRVLFGASDILIDLDFDRFQELFQASVEALDLWEKDQGIQV